MDSDPESRERTLRSGSKLNRLTATIAIGVFVTSFAGPDGIGRLPLQYVLKKDFHLSAHEMAIFFATIGFAWYLKPIAGILSDSFPLWGARRRYQLAVSSAIAGLLWLVFAGLGQTYLSLTIAASLVTVFVVLSSTVVGAVLIEAGKSHAATGRLSVVRVCALGVSVVLAGGVGGWLSFRPLLLTAAPAAVCLFSLALAAWWLPNGTEDNSPRESRAVFWSRLVAVISSRELWAVGLLLFVITVAPGFDTPLFYYQTNTLAFAPSVIGNLKACLGGCGLVGAILYTQISRLASLRSLLPPIIVGHIFSTLLYLVYHSVATATFATICYGLTLGLTGVALFDLAARATPSGSEAFGYALMLSIANGTMAFSDIAGSWMFDRYHVPFAGLVGINVGATLLALPVLLLVPRSLTQRREGEEGRVEEKAVAS